MDFALALHADNSISPKWFIPFASGDHRAKKSAEIIPQSVIEAMSKGDDNAFREVYVHTYDKLKTFLMFLLHNNEDAEEAVHDTFLYLLESRDKIYTGEKFRSYLYRIATNMAYKMMRRRRMDEKYHNYHLNYTPGFAQSPDEVVMTDEMALMISIYIDNMPPQRRRVYLLSRDEGKTIPEIAELMQLSQQTVKNYLQAAINGLRELIALFAILFISQ